MKVWARFWLAAAALAFSVSSWAAPLSKVAVPTVDLGGAPISLAPLALQLRASIPAVNALDLNVLAANAGVAAGLNVPAAPAGAKVSPSLYETPRAQALLTRLAQTGAIDAKKPVEAATPESAKKTMAAVNAVLKDFTPEQIAALPADQLAALSGLLFDHMGAARPADPRADVAALAALSQVSAAKMLSKRSAPMREFLLNPGHNDMHPDDIEVHGVPKEVKPAALPAGTVFRHYTTKEGYAEIVKSGALINGFVPYVQLSRGTFKKIFRDVGGVFLTLPGVKGDQVGVPDSTYPYYVDLVVPAALTVLEIEAGKIFMIPLPARTRGWIGDMYRGWADGGGANTTYSKALVDMDASGGPGPDLAVPVTIVKKGAAK
jgi:hypothetical protein